MFPANALSARLEEMGVPLRRFKTGTPARVNRRSLDFSQIAIQEGDEEIIPFSFKNEYIGENTDGKGFVQSLSDAGIPLAGKSICLLGAGGAARSIGVECALAGAEFITIVNRNTDRGEALATVIRENTKAGARFIPWQGAARIPEDTDILINATCVGLHPHGDECPDVDFDSVRPGMVACDVIFNPVDTPFLSRCAQRGANTIDGLGMLVNQGAINYTLWTKRKAPRDVMYAKLKAEFGM
jgi:shikimate dehydrogenase